ncbi:hypothetical protein GFY24_36135 [Nocardia sp. SYP-A9097]|uniref:hypothetical protein n=1 Tax=Nocardia sp. SYP-A9097 TaxID=2663237 RepID=UPI00129AE8F9|nr:hypothetical protein [Nocardia sp. SYP-A9097]MRH92788.1 hypothetical protein [Nocardia sp. SYP-A9097]
MPLYLSYVEDPDSGRWTVTGEQGHRTVTFEHESREAAASEVQKAFGRNASPTPPQLPPGWHRFTLMDSLFGSDGVSPTDSRYETLKSNPPQGCDPRGFVNSFGLECARPGTDLLDAVSSTCADIRAQHGLLLADAGIEQVDEWISDGKDGWGARILVQLLLMSIERGRLLGYTSDDLIRFVQRVG